MAEQVVAFRLGSEEYGIAIDRVREIIVYQGATPMPKAPKYMDGIVNIRGMIIPVIDLGLKLGVATKKGETCHALVVGCGKQQIALSVDSVEAVRLIDDKQIEWNERRDAKNDGSIRGVGKMDGELCILLDVDRLLTPDELQTLGEAAV